MAKVRLPKLRKLESSPTASVGRINIRAQDQGANILNRTNAISNFGKSLSSTISSIEADENKIDKKELKLKTSYEDDEINSLGNAGELKYNEWQIQALQKLGQFQDDPTEIYNNYEVEETKVIDSIMEGQPDLNERIKAGLAERLEKVRGSNRDKVLRQRGKQVTTYKQRLFTETVKVNTNSLPEKITHAKAGEPNSLNSFDEKLNDIRTIHAKQYLNNGLAEKVDGDSFDHSYDEIGVDENGDPKLVKVKVAFTTLGSINLAKELSSGISKSIEALMDNNRREDAVFVKDKYKDFMDGVTKSKLKTELKQDVFNSETSSKASDISLLPIEDQRDAINKISDPLKKEEIDKKVDATNRRISHTRKRQNEKFYNKSSELISSRMNSGSPFFGVTDLENDPAYKKLIRNITDQKLIDSLREQVVQPSSSSTKSVERMQELIFDRNPDSKIVGMTASKFNTFLVGLNSKDRKRYTNVFELRNTQTAGEARTSYADASKQLKNQLLLTGYIREKDGFLTERNKNKLTEAGNELMDFLSDKGAIVDQKVLKDFVKEYSEAKKKGEVFETKRNKPFFKRKIKNPLVDLTAKEVFSLRLEYKRTHGLGLPPKITDAKFLSFAQGKLNE